MDASSVVPNLNRLREIAEYFSNKTPKEITFADADNYEYEIYGLFQEWKNTFPERAFEKDFPIFDSFWEELATWNHEDDWSREKCEKIINLAKKASSEIQNHITKLSK